MKGELMGSSHMRFTRDSIRVELKEAFGRVWLCREGSTLCDPRFLPSASPQLMVTPPSPLLHSFLPQTLCMPCIAGLSSSLSKPKYFFFQRKNRLPFHITIFVLPYLNYIFEEFSFIFEDFTWFFSPHTQ